MTKYVYNAARRLNAKRKQFLKWRAGQVLSAVRRIERVHPLSGARWVAMTFDDGPCAKCFSGKKGLTESLLESLAEFGATASFDVIGTTEENYPDQRGEQGSFQFGGVGFDHYPCYGEDQLAGAVNQPELIEKILAGGHELTSHSYRHMLFGPKPLVYKTRRSHHSLEEVMGDLQRLHGYLQERFGYTVRLARPPHYVDRIPDGSSAYTAYQRMGYQYLAASYDGGGWLPGRDYDSEVRAMVEPMERLLEQDPDALNGQIIFQKDGCNMALRAPVQDALPQQLRLLRAYGYRVVSVSELLAQSPFADMPPDHPAAPYVRALVEQGHVVGYRSNIFRGNRPITRREFLWMAAPPELLRRWPQSPETKLLHEVEALLGFSMENVAGNTLLDLAMARGVAVEERDFKDKSAVTRYQAAALLAGLSETICVSS